MKPVAIIEAERPGLDCVILWDDGDRVIAFAYLEGRVQMTRPLAAENMNDAITEVRDNYQISDAQLTRIHDWQHATTQPERIVATPKRWE